MGKRIFKSAVALVLGFIMTSIMILMPNCQTVEAASYITTEQFVKWLSLELGLSPIAGSEENGYVNALIDKGILQEGDFTSYTSYLTRGDTMVLLNRADEYLYGDTLEEELVQLAIDKRISDIESVASAKREDVAKAYLKGYVKGYSNGTYSTDRTIKMNNKVTKKGAYQCILMLKDESLRAQVSPDGQLIRTTNLPISAEKYPYILASYPNSYYDWKMQYELSDGYTRNGKHYDYENLTDYASPAEVDKLTIYDNWTDMNNEELSGWADMRDEYLDDWVDKVQTYMELVFSANYKTIDDDWVESVMQTDYSYGTAIEDSTRERLEQYVTDMKENKTIVECAKVSVDGSSLYFFNGGLYLRAYVKYRIVSSKVEYGVDTDTLIMEEPYNDILWADYELVDFTEFTLGEWRECCFDIRINSYSSENPNYIGVCIAYLDE